MTLKKNESLLITVKPNVYFFSRIVGHNDVFLLLTGTKKFVFSDARFIKTATKIAKEFIPIATAKEDSDWWFNLIKKNDIQTIFFEPYELSYEQLRELRKMSKGIVHFRPLPIDLRKLRSQKNRRELTYIKQALKITENILARVIKICQQANNFNRISEFDLMLAVYKQALDYKSHLQAFQPIVAFGRNTGIPHHQPSRWRRLQRGDMILIDIGVKFHHYCADLTRTFFTSAPSSRQVEIYNKVLQAQQRTIKNIKPRVPASQLCQDVHHFFHQLTPHFTHGLGHGVGLEIHEYPSLKLNSSDVLAARQVLTVEPGLYFYWGGIRIEDMVEVKKDGCRVITSFPKELRSCIL